MSDTESTGPSRYYRPEHAAVRAGGRTDRETAIQLLKTCVATEVSCFGQILSYLGNNGRRARDLLEDVLSLEEEHAEELIGVLRTHGMGGRVRGNGLSLPRAPR